MRTALSEEELLRSATTWNAATAGRHREEDGTVPGWHEWSQLHPQREETIVVCRGREEWKKQQQQQNKDNWLSLVSWNILSDTWWRQGKLRGEYDHTPQENGEWSFRLELLLEWIESLNPTILALQEVDYDRFEIDLFPKLAQKGYDGTMQNPKKKAVKQPCGVATFWKKQQFQRVQEASFSRTLCVVLQQCQASKQQQICITNVHLESSQSSVGSDCRARQLNSALAYAATQCPTAALLVCGDCNTGADAPLFRVLRDHLWHGHALSSVYEHPDTHQTLPVCGGTFMVPGHHYVIDHIVYNQDSLRLKVALDPFSQEELQDHAHSQECGFPSAFCPSDHIPIGAMVEFLPQSQQKQQEQSELPTITDDRKGELMAQWKRLSSQRPPHTKGKPTPEQIAERQVYKAAVKEWTKTVSDKSAAELDYVTQLIKGKV